MRDTRPRSDWYTFLWWEFRWEYAHAMIGGGFDGVEIKWR